ncbi:hypothetical protein [Amycolatopsis sp. GM8]|nr:hypothetical protein [Amycolatopsis sp. GM8]
MSKNGRNNKKPPSIEGGSTVNNVENSEELVRNAAVHDPVFS